MNTHTRTHTHTLGLQAVCCSETTFKSGVRGESGSKSVSKYDLRHAVMPLCGPQRLCGLRKQIEQTNKVSGTAQGGAAAVY